MLCPKAALTPLQCSHIAEAPTPSAVPPLNSFPPPPPTPLQDPSEAPTPKRPRGRPKGSKNKASSKGRVGGWAQLELNEWHLGLIPIPTSPPPPLLWQLHPGEGVGRRAVLWGVCMHTPCDLPSEHTTHILRCCVSHGRRCQWLRDAIGVMGFGSRGMGGSPEVVVVEVGGVGVHHPDLSFLFPPPTPERSEILSHARDETSGPTQKTGECSFPFSPPPPLPIPPNPSRGAFCRCAPPALVAVTPSQCAAFYEWGGRTRGPMLSHPHNSALSQRRVPPPTPTPPRGTAAGIGALHTTAVPHCTEAEQLHGAPRRGSPSAGQCPCLSFPTRFPQATFLPCFAAAGRGGGEHFPGVIRGGAVTPPEPPLPHHHPQD